jgi:hypothetical protein
MAAFIFGLILVPVLLMSQGSTGRRSRGAVGSNAGVYNVPSVTFQGKLKALTNKELRIDVDTAEQSITFRVSRKTRFTKDGKDVKPSTIAVGTVVSVDATREPDQKFTALAVSVSPPPK